MKTKRIFDEHGHGFTRMFWDEKIENVNPIEFLKSEQIERKAILSTIRKKTFNNSIKLDINQC